MKYQYIPPPSASTRFELTREEISDIFLKVIKNVKGVTFKEPLCYFEKKYCWLGCDNISFETHFRFSIYDVSQSKAWHIWDFTKDEIISILHEFLVGREEVIPEGKVTIYAFEPILSQDRVLYVVTRPPEPY